ncbi:MAG: aminotransferase class III-fold pyridoxal phosphate-dependent enzyme [Bacteroidota bacterium]
MNPFDVYPLFDIEPVRGEKAYIWDREGSKYLDFYGGHAVISIGHSHPYFLEMLNRQMNKLPFYSNAVINPLQKALAEKLGELASIPDYQLFMCNSGAEANENALKLASFHTGKKKIISFSKGFHGRTSLAVAVTDNPNLIAPVNKTEHALVLPLNDIATLEAAFTNGDIAAVIIEGIQGIGGINVPEYSFMQKIKSLCISHEALLIADAVQCGCGRSGDYFAHDHYDLKADIYSMAKGIGNGFPVGAIAISPEIQPKYGMLGSTFGGNHLACAATLAVLDVIEREKLMDNATLIGNFIIDELKNIGVLEVRGRGLMLGVPLEKPIKDLRKKLLFEHHIFTGSSSDPNVLRLLPPLNITKQDAVIFLEAFSKVFKKFK